MVDTVLTYYLGNIRLKRSDRQYFLKFRISTEYFVRFATYESAHGG